MDLSKMTNDAMQFTKEVTERWTSRIAGTAACLACGDYLEEQMATFCDSVKTQDFEVRPGAFLGYIRINIVLYFLGLIALLAHQFIVAAVLGSLASLIGVLEFFIYWEFVDFLFPKKTGRNVIGSIEPSGEVKQQVIVSAHHDSAHIFNFLDKEPENYTRKILSGMSGMFMMFILSWLLLALEFSGNLSTTFYWIGIAVLVVLSLFVYQLWNFYDAKNGTPGAGDNLVCTALAMEIAKHFSREKARGNGLKHTRVVVASWDAEECGLRGARAYTKANKSDLLANKTYNFNLECMYDHNAMTFLTSDLNSFVPLSKSMADECVEISNSLDYNIKASAFPFLAGGTDSAEFAKIGVETTCLAAMNWITKGEQPAYHTPRDTIKSVDAEAVKRSIDVGIHYVLKKESEV